MKCSLLTLSSYIDDELEPERRAEVDAHLVGCERCHRGVDYLREEVARISGLARVHLPDPAAHAFLEQLGLIGPEDALPRRPARALSRSSPDAPPWLNTRGAAGALPWVVRPAAEPDPEAPDQPALPFGPGGVPAPAAAIAPQIQDMGMVELSGRASTAPVTARPAAPPDRAREVPIWAEPSGTGAPVGPAAAGSPAIEERPAEPWPSPPPPAAPPRDAAAPAWPAAADPWAVMPSPSPPPATSPPPPPWEDEPGPGAMPVPAEPLRPVPPPSPWDAVPPPEPWTASSHPTWPDGASEASPFQPPEDTPPQPPEVEPAAGSELAAWERQGGDPAGWSAPGWGPTFVAGAGGPETPPDVAEAEPADDPWSWVGPSFPVSEVPEVRAAEPVSRAVPPGVPGSEADPLVDPLVARMATAPRRVRPSPLSRLRDLVSLRLALLRGSGTGGAGEDDLDDAGWSGHRPTSGPARPSGSWWSGDRDEDDDAAWPRRPGVGANAHASPVGAGTPAPGRHAQRLASTPHRMGLDRLIALPAGWTRSRLLAAATAAALLLLILVIALKAGGSPAAPTAGTTPPPLPVTSATATAAASATASPSAGAATSAPATSAPATTAPVSAGQTYGAGGTGWRLDSITCCYVQPSGDTRMVFHLDGGSGGAPTAQVSFSSPTTMLITFTGVTEAGSYATAKGGVVTSLAPVPGSAAQFQVNLASAVTVKAYEFLPSDPSNPTPLMYFDLG